jgi:hypothetical protein
MMTRSSSAAAGAASNSAQRKGAIFRTGIPPWGRSFF